MSLSTEVKNHRLIFADSENRQPIFITESKAGVIRRFLKDRSATYIDLTDDQGNYSETVQKRAIKGVQFITQDEGNKNLRYICDYGTRHAMAQQCECREKFKCFGFEFMQWCEKHYKIRYTSGVTTEMQKEFLNLNKQ